MRFKVVPAATAAPGAGAPDTVKVSGGTVGSGFSPNGAETAAGVVSPPPAASGRRPLASPQRQAPRGRNVTLDDRKEVTECNHNSGKAATVRDPTTSPRETATVIHALPNTRNARAMPQTELSRRGDRTVASMDELTHMTL